MHSPRFASKAIYSILFIILYGAYTDAIWAQVESKNRPDSVEECRSIIAKAQNRLAEEYLTLETEFNDLQKLISDATISMDQKGHVFTEEIANLERHARNLSEEMQRLALLIAGLYKRVDELVESGLSKERAIGLIFGSGASETLPGAKPHAFGQAKHGTVNMLDPEYTVDNAGAELSDTQAAMRFAESMNKLDVNLVQKELEKFRTEKKLYLVRQKAGEFQQQIETSRIIVREMQSLKKLDRLYSEQLELLRPGSEVGN
jgi:hypothetical protein